MIRGKLFRIPVNKEGQTQSFAFIKGDDGVEYFLHKTDLVDNWYELCELVKSLGEVTIEFEFTEGAKGMRAVGAKVVSGNRGK